VTGRSFAEVSTHGPGIYLVQYLATCKHHASHAEPSQWNALRRLGSNSASAKAGLLLLVSSVRFGWRVSDGLGLDVL
jgi:hypothetical protein